MLKAKFNLTPKRRPLELILAPVVLSCLVCGTSCSSHVEGGSLPSMLDSADNYIAAGDARSAIAILDQAASQAEGNYESLGVFKRFMRLGDLERAETTVKKALKKDKKSPELNAVYGNLLLKMGETAKALKQSKNLSGTKYGSIYAEAFLRTAQETGKSANELFGAKKTKADREWKKTCERFPEELSLRQQVFRDGRFSPIYYDAFLGSRKHRWNWNAATLEMRDGKYAQAADKYPGTTENTEDSLFWGKVLYDAGHYPESLHALTQHEDDGGDDYATTVQLKALLSDVYYILGQDSDSAQKREEILAMDVEEGSQADSVLPSVYVNSAIYARGQEDQIAQYEYLRKAVSDYPEYIPALASYGEFALERMNRPPDDTMTAHIRAAGLLTRQMERDAAIPEINLDEIFSRMREISARTGSPEMKVLAEKLYSRANVGEEKTRMSARIWTMLEQSESEMTLYPEQIVRYAVATFINNGMDSDAENLFIRYETANHPENLSKIKGKGKVFVPEDNMNLLNLWECEMAAWFCIYHGDYDNAKRFYTHILESYADRSPVLNVSGQNESVVNTYINIGNLYSQDKQSPIALDYLNKASGRAASAEKKAEILYRMGKISYYMRDFHSASRSIQYALKLNPSHNRARFVEQQIERATMLDAKGE